MASRSARSPKGGKALQDYDDEGSVGAFLARHRTAVGGITAFAVTFAYVAANAIWYQPHAHGSAFFATRPLAAPVEGGGLPGGAAGAETIIRIEREEARQQEPPAAPVTPPAVVAVPEPRTVADALEAPTPSGDPVVEEVQRILAELNFYNGQVDGLTGPQTREAIAAYRKTVGLSDSAEIDDQLLQQLGATPRSASSAPPLPQGSPGTDMIETSSAEPKGDPIVMRIQAGLRAFGNDGIEVDGLVGLKTSAAIREFQSLFGLPVTGRPDPDLYRKMREIGLTD